MQNLITEHLDIWTAAHKTRSTAGRGSNNKLDLVGIKKLRELILELAVRGKLVPQDSRDEPASELLKKVSAEKAKLIKEGKIKKEKSLPEITDEEKPFELPEKWKYIRLGTGFTLMSGTTFEKERELESGEYLYVKVGDMNLPNNEMEIKTSSRFVDPFEKEKRSLIPSGSIVFPKRGGAIATNKKRYVREEIFVDLNVMAITPYTGIILEYAMLWLSGIDLALLNSGTSVPQINNKDIEPLLFPLPPLSEQHRIVAKVDELMAFCDQLEQTQSDNIVAHAQLVEALLATLSNSSDHNELQNNWQRIAAHFDTLFTTEHSIDQLKQTILQLAVMGKLVPQNPNDEPANELLKKIATEKAQLIKEGKIKKEKPLPEITDEEKPFELPSGWEWERFSSVANSRLGKMLDKAKNSGEMKPYLRNTNVQWGLIELDDIKEMKLEESELSEFKLEYGDLLICEGGYPGRCAIWKHKTIEMYFQKALHRARAYSGVISEYLQLCLFNDLNTGGLDKYISGATIQHFTGDKLDRYVIPIAPSEEQHRIVTKVDELMALCDTLKTNLQNAQTTQLALADALVEQAVN